MRQHHKKTELEGKVVGNYLEETVTTSSGLERDVKVTLFDLLPDGLKFHFKPARIVVEITVTELVQGE
tara:strand:+ start:225 stop:428 length:204 start_codon:yes stop_codon:yes gene_type:complete